MKLKAIVVAVLLLGIFRASAQGTFVYDQQSSDENNPGGGAISIQTASPLLQSFTPSLSTIGFIRLQLGDENAANNRGATVFIYLRQDSATGAIIGISDSVTMADGFGVGNNNIGYANFLFSNPVSVTPGTTYYFQPAVQTGGDNWGIAAYNFTYSGGVEYYQGTAFPGHNLWFREGIIVPEPSTWSLLALGAGTLFLRRRKAV